MKIAFLTRFDVSSESGILKKIRNQILTWQSEGHEVVLFAQAPSQKVWEGLKDIKVVIQENELSNGKGLKNPFKRFLSMGNLIKKITQWNPDVILLRFTTYYPSISKLMKKFPVVLEINTDDIQEYKLKFNWAKNLYHRSLRDFILNKAAGMIFVTHELKEKFSKYECHKTVVANSIDLDNFEILPAPDNDKPHFVFIGTPNRDWHGVDKIITLAKLRPDYNFDLIGPSIEDFEIDLPGNVKAHGYLSKDEYLPVMRRADIAIASLAFHRIPLTEACPLKVREYLAYGIPTIMAYNDTDFLNDDFEYILKIDNEENNVSKNLRSIDEFVLSWKGKRIDRNNVLHIDTNNKEIRKLELLKLL